MRIKDENKIDVIFKASLALILKEGIAGLTMSKLAKQAKIATGTLYIYFKSKDELFQKLYLKLNSESTQRFMKGYSANSPFEINFKIVWMNYLTHRIEHYEESIFLEQYYRSPYITKEQKHLAELMKHPVHELIQQGKAESKVRNDMDDEMLFLAMLGFIRELTHEHEIDVYKLNKERIENAFKLSWDTIKA